MAKKPKKAMKPNKPAPPPEQPAEMAVVDEITQGAGDELNMDYWRSLAREALPPTSGPWEESELGASLQQAVLLIKRHYEMIDKIARDSGERTLAFALKIEICRKTQPGQIKVGIAFSQAWKDGARVQVPDPDQTELPLAVTKTAGVEVVNPDEADAARMKEIEEQQAFNREQEDAAAKKREKKFDDDTAGGTLTEDERREMEGGDGGP